MHCDSPAVTVHRVSDTEPHELDEETEQRIDEPRAGRGGARDTPDARPGGARHPDQRPGARQPDAAPGARPCERRRRLKAWWHVANVNAVVRLQINDHSWVHIQIVANIALKLLRQLIRHGVEPSLVRDDG